MRRCGCVDMEGAPVCGKVVWLWKMSRAMQMGARRRDEKNGK